MIRVLHINTESGWRGGENQLRLFLENADRNVIENHVAALENEPAIDRFGAHAKTLPLKKQFILSMASVISKYCQKNNIDVIDAQTSKAHTLGLLIKRKNPHIKLLVHRRVDNLPSKGMLSKWKYRTAKVDQYVAISYAIKNILIGQGVSSNRITVIPSAISSAPYKELVKETEKSQLARTFSLNTDTPFIGNASALSNQKGYDTLIRAMRILKNDGVNVHCFIAGDGEKRTELESLRMELDLDQDVTFLGFIKEVPMFLTALDVLTVPSNNEGLGTIILDGTYAGCPVIASEVGGIPEMIKHQETGLLVPPNEPQRLADAIRVLIGDKEMQLRLNKNARELIEKNFSLNHMVSENSNLLTGL
jgi:L-malate glycosyltransferase